MRNTVIVTGRVGKPLAYATRVSRTYKCLAINESAFNTSRIHCGLQENA